VDWRTPKAGADFSPSGKLFKLPVRRLDVRNFNLRNRVIGPKRYGITTDNFDMNRSADFIRFRKVASAIWDQPPANG